MSTLTLSTATRVLRLYRQLLCAGRTWPVYEERKYIARETQRLFRQNRGLRDEAQIEAKIFEATSRWELAQFYKIAAP
jgi:hypothetical protein|eukprot:COSAG01_NODE_13575_length_1566_cov_1.019087_2_plen_78_part_00